jgi:tryptophan synthase alpha chain
VADANRRASNLEATLRKRRRERDILLMTHVVLGYPDFETSTRLVEAMVSAGVDIVELQIPFSEPIADGPVILHANQAALVRGATVERCFNVAGVLVRRFDIPFVLMTYYNVIFRRGVAPFTERMRQVGLSGCIVADLPSEEGGEYIAAMRLRDLDPIFIYSPRTSTDRMETLGSAGGGFAYCVARTGVTGSKTEFNDNLSDYLIRARAATALPLAVGFGIKERNDIEFLRGRADIAVIGSETLRVLSSAGVEGVGRFLSELR